MNDTCCLCCNGISDAARGALRRAVERALTQRGVRLTGEETADYTVTVHLDETMSGDRYRIQCDTDGAVLWAASVCAVFAAVGKLLRLCMFDGVGGFVPPAAGTTVDHTPAKPVRGMYFATHFYNFYHAAPMERVYDVIEELAMRGANTLLVWFDMHHYTSMRDPEAAAQAERLRQILTYANTVGMGGALTMLSNEAFAGSPAHLRAEWAVQNGYVKEPDSHYHVELCPSREGGIEEILRQRREMLEAFADLKIDYVIYWPYDQGGCTCERCAPWGANGFVRLLPRFKALIAEMMPRTRVIVSAWYFDRFIEGEWEAFLPRTAEDAFEGIPYLMSFFFKGEMPACVAAYGEREDAIPFVDFPEISMYSCTPWGAYGASVLTDFLEATNSACAERYRGGYPYSEGIFEDANKFIQLSCYTGEYPRARDALREYVRYEFCCGDEALYEAIRRTETALARKRSRTEDGIRVVMENVSDVEFVWRTMQAYHETLPESIVRSVKFRLFYLRALIDYEIMTHDGYANRSEKCQAAMREINGIYFASDKTNPWVKAPVGL